MHKGSITIWPKGSPVGFFKKIKQSMGIGTIDFTIEVPPAVTNASGRIDGTIIITSKSAQSIKDVEVKLEREQTWDQLESTLNTSTNKWEDRWVSKSNTVTIAQWKDETDFAMTEGEVKRIPFTIVFPVMANPYGDAGDIDMWDFLAPMMNLGTGLRNQRIAYRINGDADVDGAAFDKGDSHPITLA